MKTESPERSRDEVRAHYAEVARTGAGCAPGCCAPAEQASLGLGYTADDLASVPQGADLGLGCGTPIAFAGLREGETVLDLGSGGGLDCFLAARQVGPTGRVIGVDMTPEMLARARASATRVAAANVEFRLGEIERLPLADRSVDVIVSNCVINLSPDKRAVLRDAFRVLRPGGRLAISDIVASSPLPDEIRASPVAGCLAGASMVDELRQMLVDAGFDEVRIDVEPDSRTFIRDWLPGSGAEAYVASAAIHAVRPAGDGCCGSARSGACC